MAQGNAKRGLRYIFSRNGHSGAAVAASLRIFLCVLCVKYFLSLCVLSVFVHRNPAGGKQIITTIGFLVETLSHFKGIVTSQQCISLIVINTFS